MFISHCSCYSAWFRDTVPSSELRQKLSPLCVLVLWLKPTFKQCRKAVKRKVWFIHLACHSKILMLARGGITPFAFPWFQHLYTQLSSVCKDAEWVVRGAPGYTQASSEHICCARIPGHSARLTDWHRQSMQRAWRPRNCHQCQNLWRWGSSEPAWNTELWKKLA